jgi:hypothetical protein
VGAGLIAAQQSGAMKDCDGLSTADRLDDGVDVNDAALMMDEINDGHLFDLDPTTFTSTIRNLHASGEIADPRDFYEYMLWKGFKKKKKFRKLNKKLSKVSPTHALIEKLTKEKKKKKPEEEVTKPDTKEKKEEEKGKEDLVEKSLSGGTEEKKPIEKPKEEERRKEAKSSAGREIDEEEPEEVEVEAEEGEEDDDLDSGLRSSI